MAGRYQGGGVYLDPYLKGHAGDELRVDRKSRGAEYVARPALTVGLAVQPDVLRKLTNQPGFRGRGLLARFLYALPVNTVGSRKIAPPAVPEEIAERYRVDLYALARSLLDEREAAKLVGNEDPIILTPTTPAAVRLIEFEAEVEPRLHPHHGDLAHIADWATSSSGPSPGSAACSTSPPASATAGPCRSTRPPSPTPSPSAATSPITPWPCST